MRRWMLAAGMAAALTATPGHAQEVRPADAGTVTVEEEPIPVSGQNKVSPGSFAATTAGIGIVVIGIVILAGVAFLPSS